MLHHLKLSLIDFLMDAADSLAPGDHKLGNLEGVCLRPQLFKLTPGRLPEDLVPGLALFVRPSKAPRHHEHFAIEAQNFGVGHWFVTAVQCLDRLLQEGKLSSVLYDRLHLLLLLVRRTWYRSNVWLRSVKYLNN